MSGELSRRQSPSEYDRRLVEGILGNIFVISDYLEGRLTEPVIKWSEANYQDYEARKKRSFAGGRNPATHAAIAKLLPKLTGSEVLLEFGTGRAIDHPFDSFTGATIIPIEKQVHTVFDACTSGRLPEASRNLMISSDPPYNLVDSSASHALSISAFCTLPYPELKAVVADIARVMGPGGKLVHIEDMLPCSDFFCRMPPQVLKSVEQYILRKRGLSNITFGNPLASSFFWCEYTAKTLADLKKEVVGVREFSEMVNYVEVQLRGLGRTVNLLAGANGLNGSQIEKDIRAQYKGAPNGALDIFLKTGAFLDYTLLRLRGIQTAEGINLMSLVSFGANEFIHDLLEGYIAYVFQECGLTVLTDSVAVMTDNPEPHQSDFYIEGSSFGVLSEKRQPQQFNRVRVVVGKK